MSLPTTAQIRVMLNGINCTCCDCVLRQQPDFLAQKSGLEEAYDEYNLQHGTQHSCVFLPKYHPELNPIERVWGRMKWHIRKFADNRMDTLEKLMNYGLSTENIPQWLVRKFFRLNEAYILAYDNGMDMVTATAWIKKHRSHRSYSERMDIALEQLYFPYGREPHNDEEYDVDVLVMDEGAYDSDDPSDDELVNNFIQTLFVAPNNDIL